MPKNRRLMIGLVAAVMVAGFTRPALGFIYDLAGHWSAPFIGALEAKGIVKGDSQGAFKPDASLTRAQLAKLFALGLGGEADAQVLSRQASRFPDVPGWHWANGYIESLSELAITDGYPDGTFGPDDTVTRGQLAVFLTRAAGLGEEARLLQFEPTTYRDDRDIPGWARGYVKVAQTHNLLVGFEDSSFRPLQPVTRAEGSVAILRMLNDRGAAYHLSGTLVRFDSGTFQGVVRDALGVEKDFTMTPGAQYYRAGILSYSGQIRALDQVWVVLDADGKGAFIEAQYEDLLGTNASVKGDSLTATLQNGAIRTWTLQPGALLFLNGRTSTSQKFDGVPEIYVVLDRVTREVRVLDAVNAPLRGKFGGWDITTQSVIVTTGTEVQLYKVDPTAILLRDGVRIQMTDLVLDEKIRFAVNESEVVTYLQVER